MTYYCDDCNYCLRGLPDDRACPECGGRARRLGARRRRPGVKWVILGIVLAVGWGIAAGPLWRLIAPKLATTRHSSTGAWSFRSPASGAYAGIRIAAEAARQTDSPIFADSVVSSYTITIEPLDSPGGTGVTIRGEIGSLTVDAVLAAMQRAGAGAAGDEMYAEAEYVVQLITGRLAAVCTPGTPQRRATLTGSSIWGSGSSMGTLSTQYIPSVFIIVGWNVLILGWLAIILGTWRLVRAARRRLALESDAS